MKPRHEPQGRSALQPPPGYCSADGRPPDAVRRALILDERIALTVDAMGDIVAVNGPGRNTS
ncbi:hypothetical protein ACFYWO_22605 [Streptomyces sp. NPDC002932]|uniref:hypothetical protein n=1 Tax=Streptomyces sp. NPDC002932 TaxID=3364672 RepID=UPI0036ADA90F